MTRALLILALALAVALALTPAGSASSSYPAGYVNDAGYTWRDGYWWKGGCAYTRRQVSYCYGGCYKYRWVYTKIPVVVKEVPAPVSSADPDWRSKLLDIAAQRDRYEMKNRANAFDQYFFLESINALGLRGNFNVAGYGGPSPYQFALASPQQTYQLSTAGVNGESVYGYARTTTHQIYGDNYLPGLFQQLGRYTENAQKLAGQAGVDFKDALSQEGANRAKVAEVLAKGQVVAEALRAMDQGSAKVESREFHFRMTPDGKVERIDAENRAVPAPTANLAALDATIKADCLACHGGKEPKGGLDLSEWRTLSPEQWGEVISRVTTKDPAKGMPRDGTGKHRPLSADKKALYLSPR